MKCKKVKKEMEEEKTNKGLWTLVGFVLGFMIPTMYLWAATILGIVIGEKALLLMTYVLYVYIVVGIAGVLAFILGKGKAKYVGLGTAAFVLIYYVLTRIVMSLMLSVLR